ncbi:hypothetical protein FRC08_009156 [Ceratobasidium sp. 394]|nr:hypothetical protein FRC08_009156 [Ceratobasidium sp. 394]
MLESHGLFTDAWQHPAVPVAVSSPEKPHLVTGFPDSSQPLRERDRRFTGRISLMCSARWGTDSQDLATMRASEVAPTISSEPMEPAQTDGSSIVISTAQDEGAFNVIGPSALA